MNISNKTLATSGNNGHRKRLRKRFLKSGFKGFLNYEIIELLLTLGAPRINCKPIAKDLIKKFKNLSTIFNSQTEELQQIKGVGPTNIIGIKLVYEINKILNQEKLESKTNLFSSKEVFKYLNLEIGHKKKEYFVVLCLDTRNNILFDEVSIGTLNASLVHPREVFTKAILNHSSHIIVAHNHPSGNPTPSEEDIKITNRLVEAGKILGIAIVDHIIVSNNKYYSLKENRQI